MYGIIGKLIAVPGSQGELIEILIASSSGMPGCKSYIIAKDAQDPDGIWITEVWDS